MVHVEAIFSNGAFRSIEPLAMPEGTRVRLSIEAHASDLPMPRIPKLNTPKLARREDAADFVMEVESATPT